MYVCTITKRRLHIRVTPRHGVKFPVCDSIDVVTKFEVDRKSETCSENKIDKIRSIFT